MKREVKKDEEGNGGFLRETVVAWSGFCCKLGNWGKGCLRIPRARKPGTFRPPDRRTA